MERGGGHEEEVQQPPLPRGDRRGTKEQEDQRGYGVQRRVAERHARCQGTDRRGTREQAERRGLAGVVGWE